MRAVGLSLALALFSGLLVVAPGVQANHWCAPTETFVAVLPSFPSPGAIQEFTISFQNVQENDTQLTNISVLFDWESTPRSLTGGSLSAGAYLNRTVTPSATPAGLHHVTVTFSGTNAAHPPTEVATCERTRSIVAIDRGTIFGGLFAFVIVVIVVVALLLIISLFVLPGRKKRGTPRTPPQEPPPMNPPEGPPSAPPESPPL